MKISNNEAFVYVFILLLCIIFGYLLRILDEHPTNNSPVITSIESCTLLNTPPEITDVYFEICSRTDGETELCCLLTRPEQPPQEKR